MYLCPEDQGNQPSPLKGNCPVKRPSPLTMTPEKTPSNSFCLPMPTRAPSNRFQSNVQKSLPSPIVSPQKLLQTNDIIPDDVDGDSLIPLSPNLTEEEYLFTLTDTEGIADFFESCDLWN